MTHTIGMTGWVLRHRAEVNAALYALALAAVLLGALGGLLLGASPAGALGVGAVLGTLALPWTRWLRHRTEERAWRNRELAGAHYRPPLL